ncbi:hypothetical protein D3C74_323390 [compost metagenome]
MHIAVIKRIHSPLQSIRPILRKIELGNIIVRQLISIVPCIVFMIPGCRHLRNFLDDAFRTFKPFMPMRVTGIQLHEISKIHKEFCVRVRLIGSIDCFSPFSIVTFFLSAALAVTKNKKREGIRCLRFSRKCKGIAPLRPIPNPIHISCSRLQFG